MAFTLLEVMIVGVLVSVLMLGVWSLFRSWGQLYEQGERRVQSAQLVRSLCDQFTDDVRSVTYVAPPPQRPRPGTGGSWRSGRRQSSASGGNLALVGEANWLMLEVLQPPHPFLQPTTPAETLPTDDESPVLAAPELQRVMYTFEPPASDEFSTLSAAVAQAAQQDDTAAVGPDEEEESQEFAGLLRLAVAAEQFDALASGSMSTGTRGDEETVQAVGVRDAVWQLRELIVGPPESDGLSTSTTSSLSAREPASEGELPGVVQQDVVPEVIRLEFRYFDGSSWTSSWNSQSQGRLPVAIELRFELEKPEPLRKPVDQDEETELVPGNDALSTADEPFLSPDAGSLSSTDSAASAVDALSDEPTPYHRCVVYLEPAPQQPPPAAEALPTGEGSPEREVGEPNNARSL